VPDDVVSCLLTDLVWPRLKMIPDIQTQTEDDIAAALLREARSRGSEDDVTIIVARISFSPSRSSPGSAASGEDDGHASMAGVVGGGDGE
jgi:hypothetical protein